MSGIPQVAAPSTCFELGRNFWYSISCPLAIPATWLGIQLWRLGRESPHPSAIPTWWGRGFLVQVWFHPMAWSTLNLWWALHLVILLFVYQVDEFTHIWSVEWFAVHSHNYPGLISKVCITYPLST